MSDKLHIAVIYGSVRKEREGIRGARFIVNKIKERGNEVQFVDPCEIKLPMLDKLYEEYEKGKAPEDMEKLAKILKKADAYVIVTAEYNHGVPPALKNLLDHYMGPGFFKPAGIVSYSTGGFGGVRAAEQWRSILPEMGMPTIPSMFPMPKVGKTFDEEGKALDEKIEKRVKKFLDELEWYAYALKVARKKGTPY